MSLGAVSFYVLEFSFIDEDGWCQVQAASWGILLPTLDGNRKLNCQFCNGLCTHPGVLLSCKLDGYACIWKEQACPGAVGSKVQMLFIFSAVYGILDFTQQRVHPLGNSEGL